MKIYSWNVNGIRAVVNKGLLQAFMAEHQPDVLCLNETKAQQGQAVVDLGGYYEYWNSAQKAGYSGTAIFSKVEPLQAQYGFPEAIVEQYDLASDDYGDPNSEGRMVSVEFEQFWVVSVYTPNSKEDLSRLPLRYDKWDPAFLAYIKELEKAKPVIFCGDLNVAHEDIDLANPKPNRGKHGFTDEERERFGDFITAGFIDTFRTLHPEQTGAYSWWSHFAQARARNVGWRIDYIVISGVLKDKLIEAHIHPLVLGSDHCPVSVTLQV